MTCISAHTRAPRGSDAAHTSHTSTKLHTALTVSRTVSGVWCSPRACGAQNSSNQRLKAGWKPKSSMSFCRLSWYFRFA